jgi:murein DD-endopeptidase MepM/ murein hydrolase activator NlpD
LLDPDFYMHYGPLDSNDLIGQDMINSAVNSIKTSHDQARQLAEENWLEGYYKESVLGATAYDEVKDALEKSLALTHNAHFLPKNADGPNGEKVNGVINGISSEFQSQLGDKKILHPIDLQKTIPQSIEAWKTAHGTEMSIGERKRNATPVNNKHPQKSGFTLNTRSESTLKPAREDGDNSLATLAHTFGTAVLDELGPMDIWPVELAMNSLEEPVWFWPVDSRRVTSPYGPRDPSIGSSAFHHGVDLRAFLDAPIYAAAAGNIIRMGYTSTAGNFIVMKHDGGYESKYMHLALDPLYLRYQDLLETLGPVGVPALTQIGTSGATPPGMDAHLHFEIWKNGSDIDPLPKIQGNSEGYAYPAPVSTGGAGPGDSVFTKSIEQFEANIARGQGPSLMRAYPTFKLYFIESDLGERKRFGFDDFFGYNAIKEIQVVRSRKLAADLCVIQLTNISGTLSNRKFQNAQDPGLARDAEGNVLKEDLSNVPGVDSGSENPIASLLLQPGIQIQLRLGYSNNPDLLEKVFNGMIMDVQFTEDDDLVTIVCQSYGVELVHTVYGDVKKLGGAFSNKGATSEIVEEVLAAPEVVHFGRWEPGSEDTLGGARSALTNRWSFKDTPVDDNVWAPTGKGLWGIFDWTPKYILYQSTIWDVLQEMTYRHPGYVAMPVPYDGVWGPRMTMFFGVPDQLYYARDPSFAENNVIALLGAAADDALGNLETDIQELFKTPNLDEEAKDLILKAKENIVEDDEGRERVIRKVVRQLGLDRGFIRPFRGYHIATGGMHILMNSIQSAAHNTFNQVTVQYETDSWGADVEEGTASIEFDDPDTFTLKADAGIPDEDVRELFVQYPNCNGEPMAIRYALSHLKNSLKEGYRGSLVMIGNPQIKPYDIVYVFDEYNDMFGPVEVEQVVHKFSQQNGFVTEITPDMCVHVNELSTMSTLDAMGLIAEGALVKAGMSLKTQHAISNNTVMGIVSKGLSAAFTVGTAPITAMVFGAGNIFGDPSANAIGATSPSSFGGLVGAFIYRKLFMRTQLAHPFRFSPLVHHGKPLLGGANSIRKTSGSFIQRVDKWLEDTNKDAGLYIDHLKDTMNPNNWFGNSTGSFSAYFQGTESDFTEPGS